MAVKQHAQTMMVLADPDVAGAVSCHLLPNLVPSDSFDTPGTGARLPGAAAQH